jgi:hypothetical protein
VLCYSGNTHTCVLRAFRYNVPGMNRFIAAALSLAIAPVLWGAFPAGFTVPESTLSPDGRLGVLTPDGDHYDGEKHQNKLVEVATGRELAVIKAVPGFEELNNGGITAQWSADGAYLLWTVQGKWAPHAMVLFHIKQGAVVKQSNVLQAAQTAALERARKAKPEAYAAAKEANKDNGSAYPDGFTVDVRPVAPEDAPLKLPLRLEVDLTSDPKAIEDDAALRRLDAHLDGEVDALGNFTVSKFKIGMRPETKE